MNSPEFTPEPWNWPFWAQREKNYKRMNLLVKFYCLGSFNVRFIYFWAEYGENLNSRYCPHHHGIII